LIVMPSMHRACLRNISPEPDRDRESTMLASDLCIRNEARKKSPYLVGD
jgi:hypothetical protein